MEPVTPRRVLVFLPNWIGDVVMATPALRAIRSHLAGSRIVAVGRPYVKDVLNGLDLGCEVRGLDSLKDGAPLKAMLADARALRRERYNLAILMPNSIRVAAFAFMTGAKARVGYSREGRGPLLTVRLKPKRSHARYEPAPMIDYYLALAAAVGAPAGDRAMRLVVTPQEHAAADAVCARFGIDASKRIAVLCPGAAFGSSKCWPPLNFAAVADALSAGSFETLVVTAPREADIAEKIAGAATSHLKPIWRADFTLGLLKAFIARAAVVVTNDSAPRHYAAALGTPVVTLFGPTDERWSETGFQNEIIINKHVECSPCQLKVCPRDHVCMTSITPSDAISAIEKLLGPWSV